MAEPSLTEDDMVFLHAMGAIALAFQQDMRELDVYIHTARERLPHVNREHRIIGSLADAADTMLASPSGQTRTERVTIYASGRDQARAALRAYFKWRLAQVLAREEGSHASA